MSRTAIAGWLGKWFGRASKGQARRPRATLCRPRLEGLEDRTVPSQLVTNLLDNGAAGTLRDAIDHAAASDTISFAPGLAGTITLTQGELLLVKDLDIEGPGAGAITISGHKASRAFEVAAGHSVTIAGLTISDGRAVKGSADLDLMGGGIANAGSLILRHDLFTDNQALLTGGGVANLFGASLTVSQCDFTDNQALGRKTTDPNVSSGGRGGALFNGGSASVDHTTFTSNSATGGSASGLGGAIMNRDDGSSLATLIVSDSTFTNNEARDGLGNFAAGGAIVSASANPLTSLVVSNSTFTGNRAVGANTVGFGGAIHIGGPTKSNVTGSIFTNNQATGYFYAEGGAFMNFGSSSIGGNSTFTGNQAIGTGPGAEAYGGVASNEAPYVLGTFSFAPSLTITDCKLSNNEALGGAGGDGVNKFGYGQGGAINSFSTLTVRDSTLKYNRAVGGTLAPGAQVTYLNASNGGGIAIVASTGTVTGSTLIGNVVRGGDGAAGVAGSPGLGGGIEVAFGATATVSNCLLSGNIAQGGNGGSGAAGGVGAGGGIEVSTDSVSGASRVAISDCVFLGNQALGGAGGSHGDGGDGVGGGISVGTANLFGEQDTSSLSISGSTISGNEAQGGAGGTGGHDGQGQGGGLYVAPGASVKLKKTSITGNDASTSGDNVFGL